MSFFDDLAAARTAERAYEDVDVLLNGNLHTLRFTQSAPDEWAEVTDKNPPRIGVAIDKYGFNLRKVVRALAPLVGELIVDGKPTKLRVDPVGADDRVDEWDDLLSALSGHFIGKIGDAIFNLNVYAPAQAVADAKKKQKRSEAISALQSSSE